MPEVHWTPDDRNGSKLPLFRQLFSINYFVQFCYHSDNKTFKYVLKSKKLFVTKFIEKLTKNETNGPLLKF